MDRSRNIRLSEARALLRLANRLHVINDPLDRKKQLMEGLCHLVDGSAGSCTVTQLDPPARMQSVVSIIEYRAAEMRGESLGPIPSAPQSPLGRHSVATRELPALHSTLKVPESAICATLSIFRSPQRGGFVARQHRLVDLFHSEMTWVYQPDVLLTSPNAFSLTPRARQTLQHLLAGLSEKQIASQLHLSPNTVHHYVKSIHRHFGVSSRSELLARWVRK
jgi:DNA-binding CsgD family transcriptional regulator